MFLLLHTLLKHCWPPDGPTYLMRFLISGGHDEDMNGFRFFAGYVLVSLMLRFMQRLSVAEAVKQFAKLRPPGIYKEDYVQSLFDYYHEHRCILKIEISADAQTPLADALKSCMANELPAATPPGTLQV